MIYTNLTKNKINKIKKSCLGRYPDFLNVILFVRVFYIGFFVVLNLIFIYLFTLFVLYGIFCYTFIILLFVVIFILWGFNFCFWFYCVSFIYLFFVKVLSPKYNSTSIQVLFIYYTWTTLIDMDSPFVLIFLFIQCNLDNKL